MASGVIYSESQYGYQLKAVWEQIPDRSSNTSTLTFDFYIVANSSGSFTGSQSGTGYSYLYLYGHFGDQEMFSEEKIRIDGFSFSSGTTYFASATSSALSHNTDGSIDEAAFGASLSGMFTTSQSSTGKYNMRFHFPDGNSVTSNYDSDLLEIANELERFLFPSEATVSTAYIGDKATITLNKRVSDYKTTIEYNFGNLSGTVVSGTTASSYSWTIPGSFLYQFAANETSKKGTLTITTYENDGVTIIGTTVCDFTVLLDAGIGGPTFSPTVVDTNSTTIALTGNSNIIVRYYSNAKITTGAAGVNGATISSQKTTCGSKSFTGSSGTITAVESRNYVITATDSRGLSNQYNGTFSSFVDYSKLSCNLFPNFVGTDGKLTFSIEGNCFKGSFGSVSNTLTLQYRYRTKNGSFGSWVTVSPTHTSSHNYSVNVNLSGLDYRTTYIFQAKVTDKLATVTTPEIVMTSSPIFDWSETDFQFNVEVGANYDFIYSNSAEIMGTDTSGNTRQALAPCDSAGNTVLGYGGYQTETGATKIYGDRVDIIANGEVTVNGGSLSLVQKLINAVTNSYSFTPTVTKGSSYSSASCALTLRGNCLYCRIYGSRSSASGSGDIADELIGKVSFNHGGKITGMDYVGAISSQTGTAASIAMKNPSVSGNTATFDAYLTNSATAGTNFMATFVIPVSLNLNNF